MLRHGHMGLFVCFIPLTQRQCAINTFMNDFFALIVFIIVFKALGGILGAIFGGEKRNDFRRDR